MPNKYFPNNPGEVKSMDNPAIQLFGNRLLIITSIVPAPPANLVNLIFSGGVGPVKYCVPISLEIFVTFNSLSSIALSST